MQVVWHDKDRRHSEWFSLFDIAKRLPQQIHLINQ
jgi:uncharacterized protein with von Willebrand factor type A (vWA) domain